MKSIIISVVATLFLALPAFGQNKEARKMEAKEKRDRIEAQRAAFITTRLALSSEQSAKFWPAYNQMQEELREMKKKLKKQMKEMGSIEEMSEATAKKMLQRQLEVEEQALAIKRKYYEQYLNIIEAKQVAKLQRAEQDFKREVLREMRERKEHREMRIQENN